jgi:hypothetical protein
MGCLSCKTKASDEQNICYKINQSTNTAEKYSHAGLREISWIHIDPIADHKVGDVMPKLQLL